MLPTNENGMLFSAPMKIQNGIGEVILFQALLKSRQDRHEPLKNAQVIANTRSEAVHQAEKQPHPPGVLGLLGIRL
jgi:hypothetical protein